MGKAFGEMMKDYPLSIVFIIYCIVVIKILYIYYF